MKNNTLIEIENLQDVITQYLEVAVDQATEIALNYLCNYINDNWYETYTPRSYERTYDFLASATKLEAYVTQKGKVVAGLYFDTNKIIPEKREKGFNAHMSNSGVSTADSIPYFIEYTNDFFGRRKVSKNGLRSMEKTIEMLEKNFPSMVQKELKKLGLDVKVVKK